TLPFGTKVLVTRPDTGQEVEVLINDRGPFVQGRVIDLSKRAARKLGMIQRGVVPVMVTQVD
ncbi:septal ring lytic transglycosylase RlpA family protein, partial [Vreelandella alkaliphila]